MKQFLRSALLLAVAVLSIPACGDPVAPPTSEQILVPGSTEYPHASVKESVFHAGTGKEYRLYEPDSPPLLMGFWPDGTPIVEATVTDAP